tara:strand:+ start:8260 stop:8445 length:186 start_codon:yes stop_codon:yes gene_type:complete
LIQENPEWQRGKCLFDYTSTSVLFELQKVISLLTGEIDMWTKPEYSDMRFGFEVTMYICNR